MADSHTKAQQAAPLKKTINPPLASDWVCSNASLRDAGGEPIVPGECVNDFDAWPEHQRQGCLGMGWVMRRNDYQSFRARDAHIVVAGPQVIATVPQTRKWVPEEEFAQRETESRMDFTGHDIDPTTQEAFRVSRLPRTQPVDELEPGDAMTLSNGDVVQVPEYAPRAGAMDASDDAPVECEKCLVVFSGETARKAHDVREHGFDAFA